MGGNLIHTHAPFFLISPLFDFLHFLSLSLSLSLSIPLKYFSGNLKSTFSFRPVPQAFYFSEEIEGSTLGKKSTYISIHF